MAAPAYISSQQSYGPGIAVVQANLAWNAAAPLDAITPIRFALVQSCSFEFDLKLKPAYGMAVFPVAYGSGQGSIKGKLKALSMSGWALNAMCLGQTATPPNGYQVTYNAPYNVPASTPYTITITGAKQDLGVMYAPAAAYPSGCFSQQLAAVASGPTTGQYTFNAASGVYTFAAGDAGKAIVVTYGSLGSAPWYEQWQFNNPIQGSPPTFSMQFTPIFNGQSHRLTMPNCCMSKYSLPTKQGDWVEFEIDFEVFTAGESGLVFSEDMVAL